MGASSGGEPCPGELGAAVSVLHTYHFLTVDKRAGVNSGEMLLDLPGRSDTSTEIRDKGTSQNFVTADSAIIPSHV